MSVRCSSFSPLTDRLLLNEENGGGVHTPYKLKFILRHDYKDYIVIGMRIFHFIRPRTDGAPARQNHLPMI